MKTEKLCVSREQGASAVELALLLPILVILLMFPIFYGRVCWHYTVSQKAAQDAARYLSSMSLQELKSSSLAPYAVDVARQIAETELGELAPGGGRPKVDLFCGTLPCTGLGSRPAPTYVRVVVRMDIFDTMFGVVDTGRWGLPITVDVSVPYVGQ